VPKVRRWYVSDCERREYMNSDADTSYGKDFSDEEWKDTYNGEEGIDRRSWYFKMNMGKYEEVHKK